MKNTDQAYQKTVHISVLCNLKMKVQVAAMHFTAFLTVQYSSADGLISHELISLFTPT
jgi:hypothetical protein